MVYPVINLTCAEQPGPKEAQRSKILALGIPPGCFLVSVALVSCFFLEPRIRRGLICKQHFVSTFGLAFALMNSHKAQFFPHYAVIYLSINVLIPISHI